MSGSWLAPSGETAAGKNGSGGAVEIHQDSNTQAAEMGSGYGKQEGKYTRRMAGAWRAGLESRLELRPVGGTMSQPSSHL